MGRGLSYLGALGLYSRYGFVASVLATVLSAGARVGVGGGVRVPYACVSVHGQG